MATNITICIVEMTDSFLQYTEQNCSSYLHEPIENIY